MVFFFIRPNPQSKTRKFKMLLMNARWKSGALLFVMKMIWNWCAIGPLVLRRGLRRWLLKHEISIVHCKNFSVKCDESVHIKSNKSHEPDTCTYWIANACKYQIFIESLHIVSICIPHLIHAKIGPPDSDNFHNWTSSIAFDRWLCGSQLLDINHNNDD